LLNQAYQIKQANLRYKCKDPLKRPAILYITQENSVDETVDRLFSLCVSEDTKDRMKNYKVPEAIKLLRNKGKLKITKDNNIDIIIMYKPAGSIDTSDIRAEIENLAEEGIEVMCLIHDYIKKIRSVTPAKEMRHELGYIVDEFKSIAVDYEIPVLLANQLNRDASKTVDSAIECNKTDLARFIGAANVSEAWSTIENADWVGIINRERVVSTNQLYLTIKRLKIRYGSDDSIDYFNHPFAKNEFGLLDDAHLEKSLSKRNLAESLVGEKMEEDESIIKFEKRGETSEKKRKDKTKEKDEKEKYSLNRLDEIFSRAS
jgi:Replicative DNA helicase